VGASRGDLLQAMAEIGERLGPQTTEPRVRFASLLTPSAPSPGTVGACDAAGSPPVVPQIASSAAAAPPASPARTSVAVGSGVGVVPTPATAAKR